MKLHLDRDACTGHGRCYTLAPELLDSDDAGRAVIRVADLSDGDADLAAKARQAVANCPERALSITP